MNRPLTLFTQSARWCGACLWSFGVWGVWLVLALVLAIQIYIASANELEVPGFVLRAFEARLAASGVRVTFGRSSFDPSGRVLIEDARISLPAYAEPVASARALFVQLDPWALAVGHFEPRQLRVVGANWSVPAMLSPSGRAEEIMRDLDAVIVPADNSIVIEQFVARVAGVVVSAHGTARLPGAGATREKPLPVADFLAHNYPALCRQLVATANQLATLEAPALHLELEPSETRGAIARAELLATSYRLAEPVPVAARGLRIVTRFPLLGDTAVAAQLELTADELDVPFEATARHVRAVVHGTLSPAQFRYEPHEFLLTAASVAAAGFTAQPVAARVTPGPLPQIGVELVTELFGAPLAAQAVTDFSAHTAQLRFAGAISSEIFGPLTARLHTDVRHWFNFESLECRDGTARFGPEWKFQNLTASLALRGIDAAHVRMDEGHAEIEFDGHRLHSPDAYARIGDSFARGTYDHDLATRDYRFLLEGQLQPPAIGGWWPSGWWNNFFQNFEFPVAPPHASVDVRGRWTDATQSAVFVFADAGPAVIRTVAFDRVRTRLFIRPEFYDGLANYVVRGTTAARGTFTYTTDEAKREWSTFEIDATSTVDPTLIAQIIGPAGAEVLAPFKFAQPPALKVVGRLDGAAAPAGAHQSLHIEAHSPGEFRVHDFPLDGVTFTADLHDDTLTVDPIATGFAGGSATGRLKLWGRAPDRRASFDFTLKEASLGRAAGVLQEFSARQHQAKPTPAGKFVTERANVRLDATAAAEGRYGDPFSYHGTGTATLSGVGLGEVRMLGLLSELFKFTALRFTTAQANFKIDGTKLTFPDVKLTGANSAIEAHGDYALDKRELDFAARIFPFHESGNTLKKIGEVLLTPITSVFEVKLTGTLDDPKWGLALGSSRPPAEEPALDKGGSLPATEPKSSGTPPPANASAPKP